MAELGKLDGRAKLDLIENFAQPRIGERGPPAPQIPNKLVQLMRGYPTGEQAQTDLLQAQEQVLAVGTGLLPVVLVAADFLDGQHTVEHVGRAGPAQRRRLGANRQLGREIIPRSTCGALPRTDRARIRSSCSRNLHRPCPWVDPTAAKLHATPLKKP